MNFFKFFFFWNYRKVEYGLNPINVYKDVSLMLHKNRNADDINQDKEVCIGELALEVLKETIEEQ